MLTREQTLESVKEYYGKRLKSSKDLQTNACCLAEAVPSYLKGVISDIHPEIQKKFYGCGSPIPQELWGRTVVDLGSGAGRDCFVLSRLVGAEGSVIGIDMTEEPVRTANQYVEYHTEKYGYSAPNVRFVAGYIEDLESLSIASGTVDVVTSNCVINLSPDKRRVFSEVFRVLKPGGELYFSDVFSNRRIPESAATDPELLGECLGGALYIEDFRRLLASVGCRDFRIISSQSISVNNPALETKIGMASFYSMTIRAFKLEELEDRCEDYGQVGYYLGTMAYSPSAFLLDDHHLFETGKPLLICSNTAAMISKTRYSPHFKVMGNLSSHYGLFDCAPTDITTHSRQQGACC